MVFFEDRDDVREWLAPLDFEAFWREVALFEPDIEPREVCEADIASGEVDEATVLEVLKQMVWLELCERFHLPWRDRAPWHSKCSLQ